MYGATKKYGTYLNLLQAKNIQEVPYSKSNPDRSFIQVSNTKACLFKKILNIPTVQQMLESSERLRFLSR